MLDFRKDYFKDERDDDLNVIGKGEQRQDALGHVTGRSPFYDDHLFDGLLHLKCARSPHHHARIASIDTREAEAMPGVVRVLTGKDVPVNLNTLLSLLEFGLDDEPVLTTEKVCYKGEPVVAVIAETERQSLDAVAKVRIEWQPLPHVLDVEEALEPGAPIVNEVYPANAFVYHDKYDHQKLRYGDVEKGFREADHVVEGVYQMSPIEQAPTEPCGAIAAPETNDRWVCYTSTQGLFFSLGVSAKLLDVSSSRLHFIGGTVGGGFGGKVDSLHEPLAILGAMLTGRPVRYGYNREEEMQVGAPRGGERWVIKDGVMNDGRLTARRFVGYFDAGAYTRLSSYAVVKGTGHLPGPYTIPNVSSDVFCVFTNRTPATAMRGFGITGVDFSIEAHMDKVAHTIGMDPIEFRIVNAYRDGDMKAHRRETKNAALIECCHVAAEKAGWRLSANAMQASSLRDGGGVRGEIPAVTATDMDGSVRSSNGEPRTQARPLSHLSGKTAADLFDEAPEGSSPHPSTPPPQRPSYASPGEPRRPSSLPSYLQPNYTTPTRIPVEPTSITQAPPAASPPPPAASPTVRPEPAQPATLDASPPPVSTEPEVPKRRSATRFSSISGLRRR
ncbi:MAG: molybdopterin cofactor-binding domain-containing protein [Pseudomonadota bacterium]